LNIRRRLAKKNIVTLADMISSVFFPFFSFFLHQTAIGEKEETVIALNAMVSNMTRQKSQMVMFIYE